MDYKFEGRIAELIKFYYTTYFVDAQSPGRDAQAKLDLTNKNTMALCGAYRRLATQVAGRLRYAPLCLTTAERAIHTTQPTFVPPEPKAVPIPKLKDRCASNSVMLQT